MKKKVRHPDMPLSEAEGWSGFEKRSRTKALRVDMKIESSHPDMLLIGV
jgi:hypothetical protein